MQQPRSFSAPSSGHGKASSQYSNNAVIVPSKLQTLNNEIVDNLDTLAKKREGLEVDISSLDAQASTLRQEIARLQEKLVRVEEELQTKHSKRAECDELIGESEQAYLKIVESSGRLLQLLQQETQEKF